MKGIMIKMMFDKTYMRMIGRGARKGGFQLSALDSPGFFLTRTNRRPIETNKLMTKMQYAPKLRTNMKPSPGGVTYRNTLEMKYWVERPANGALKGLLLDRKLEKGRIPSLPIS
jgi:hypothetical protein